MLQSLRVKNLALIEETEVVFDKGLNILTGETGAGKSLIIGSINLALGAKFDKDMLRNGTDNGLVELVFSDDSEIVNARLNELDLTPEDDGTIIISRKLSQGKSICKINGETVTAKQVKELAEVLIDIHGQHEHQSLLNKKKHLEILDTFCGDEYQRLAALVAELYRKCKKLSETIDGESLDEKSKLKEQSLAEFELNEIEAAKLTTGEDDELENSYRKMVNSKKITENLSECYSFTGNDSQYGAGGGVSRALRTLRSVVSYDSELEKLEEQLSDIDGLLSDFNRDISSYMSDMEFDEEDFSKLEDRLNLINRLKDKYGNTIEEILEYADSRRELLEKLSDYDAYMNKLKLEFESSQAELLKACEELSLLRQKEAKILTDKLREALLSLNFLTVLFEIEVRPNQTVTANGYDDVEFMISTNPGEKLKALGQVASGGELSRVMLAIKTVLAGNDSIDTLIFDEIDAGISGKTAWKVSEQLSKVASKHQVICITHLPQIAAMADAHFLIEKSTKTESGTNNDTTITNLKRVDDNESLEELARLLGSDTLTQAALSNAKQMKEQADNYKKHI